MTTDFRKWLAVGTGLGIEVRNEALHVAAVRVRPWETAVLGAATVTDFRSRPAAEWGNELGSFLNNVGAGHIAATVLLPRRDLIIRQIHLPGVSNRDLAAAVQLQVDTLHPLAEDDIYYSYARLGKTPAVLVGIVRRDVLDHYGTLFAEAGIKVASFTFSAAVFYAAMRVTTAAPNTAFLTVLENEAGVEVYGESESRPIFSSVFELPAERAAALAASELRLERDTPITSIGELLPRPSVFPPSHDPDSLEFARNALVYATGLAGACPWLGINGNLLPPEQRRGTSRVRLIPTFALSGTLAVLLLLLVVLSNYADARYLGVLQHEVRRFESQARKVEMLDRATTAARARTQSLDDFRRRARFDIDTLAELTKLIAPPGWLASMDLDRETIQIAGEVEQAATLLKAFDGSPYFERSEFTMPINRGGGGEIFRLRARRQAPSLVQNTPPQPASQPQPGQAKSSQPPPGSQGAAK